jgi:hypothetical protein
MAIEQVKPAPGEAKPALQMENIDVAEVGETFADSVRDMSFDGQTFRLELCVTRMDAPADAQAPRRARRYTACRIVLPTTAALDLAQKLGRVLSVVVKQNMAKATVEPPAGAKSA